MVIGSWAMALVKLNPKDTTTAEEKVTSFIVILAITGTPANLQVSNAG
jgi:hypothetical protein